MTAKNLSTENRVMKDSPFNFKYWIQNSYLLIFITITIYGSRYLEIGVIDTVEWKLTVSVNLTLILSLYNCLLICLFAYYPFINNNNKKKNQNPLYW